MGSSPQSQYPQPQPKPDLHPNPQQLPAAIVAYLLNDAKLNEAVFTRALLALADDGWLRIEPEDAGVPVVRINRQPQPGQVKPFEQLALDRVAQRMGTLAHVPLSALTSNEGEDYAPWWKRFDEAVKAQAREDGLITRGLNDGVACTVPWGFATAGGIAAAIAASSVAVGFGAGIAVLLVFSLAVHNADRPKLTKAGAAAVEWWRQHGGGFDGAVIADRLPPGALPSPNSPESLAAQGSAPLPDGYVWSSYGGRWHTVKVGSLDVPSWGKPMVAVFLSIFGVFFTLPATVVGRVVVGGGIGTLIAITPLTVCGALLFGTWLPAYRRRARIPKRGAFTGQVVKRWTYESGGEDSTTYHCCCIDDGVSPEGWSFRIGNGIYEKMRVGDIVYVDFNPRWHKVKQIQLGAPAPAPGLGPTPAPGPRTWLPEADSRT